MKLATSQFVRLLTILIGCLAASATNAQPNPGDIAQIELLQNTLTAVADELRPSVVAIRAERWLTTRPSDAKPMPDDDIHRKFDKQFIPAIGSGVIIQPNGLILTNEHVIRRAANIQCTLSTGKTYAVKSITSDPRSDLAVLRIEAEGLKPVRLGDLSTVRQGHFAITMGNPFGSASASHGRPAMSFGIVSALGQNLTHKLDPRRYYGNLIQTDARINPGNSGGPLLNIKGEVIGIITAISTRSGGSEGVGYAVAMDERTKGIIAKLAKGEKVEYGFLGVWLDDPTEADRKQAGFPGTGGALIKRVKPGTPAAKANLQSGDIVAKYDGQTIEDIDKLIRMVGATQVGTKVDMVIFRAEKRLTLSVTLGRRKVLEGINRETP